MESPETAAGEIRSLRAEAAAHLQDAARCDDPVRGDALLREALALLDRARVLRDWAESQTRGADGFGDSLGGGAGPSTRMH